MTLKTGTTAAFEGVCKKATHSEAIEATMSTVEHRFVSMGCERSLGMCARKLKDAKAELVDTHVFCNQTLKFSMRYANRNRYDSKTVVVHNLNARFVFRHNAATGPRPVFIRTPLNAQATRDSVLARAMQNGIAGIPNRELSRGGLYLILYIYEEQAPVKSTRTIKAFAYLRTSSAANIGEDKDSGRRQLQAIEGFAKRASIELVGTYHDEAVKGSDPIDTRPGFAEMLEALEANGTKTIIVETANRFARDLMVQEVGFAMLKARASI